MNRSDGSLDDAASTQTSVQDLVENEVLPLHEPSCLWVVETGRVGVFGVALREGRPSGPRTFFFTAAAGHVLFGLPGNDPGGDGDRRVSVVAVGLEPATLRRYPLGAEAEACGGARAVAEWMERWRACLATGEAASAGDLASPGSLPDFQLALLRRLAELSTPRQAGEEASLRDRERRTRATAEQAVGELVAVLEPRPGLLAGGSELFVAAAALGRVLGLELRQPAPWEGRAETVEQIARASRVRVRSVVLRGRWWHEDAGPLLGFLGDEHRPVALLPHGPGRYRLFDPRTGETVAVDGARAASVAPRAHVFYRPLPDAARSAALLRFALHGRGGELVFIVLTAAAATVLGMFTPVATALVIDQAIPDTNPDLLVWVGLGLLAAALGSAVFRLAQGRAMLRLETATEAATQPALWDRLLQLPLPFFRRFSTGDLQSRVSAVAQIRSYLGGTTLRTLFGSIVALVNLGLLVFYSPSLAWLAIAVAALASAVTVGSGVWILRRARAVMELRGKLFGLLIQLLNGIAKLRVTAAEERAFGRWARGYARLLKEELRQVRLADAVQVWNLASSTASSILLFVFAAALIRGGNPQTGMTTGAFLAFLVAYGTFVAAVVATSDTVTDVLAIKILRERASPILEAIPEVTERKVDPGRLSGRIDLEHVSFRYAADGPLVMSDVTMRVEAGRFIALVGPSGSGKSTLLRLLLAFETPSLGAIYYDRQDLAGLDVQAVRRQLGVVLQNGRITAGSILDNIAGGSSALLQDVWDAARDAGFAPDIEEMPMGMHTIVSEAGTNLSGGQRQRLLLARALVHRPRILLLDEATSALDNQTQAVVSEGLERLAVTRIVVAHRLSTIRRADHICVIDAGRIVEDGSFTELAGNDGLFARLIARQIG